jgi:thiol-disulfide isomerase/thioredoxin
MNEIEEKKKLVIGLYGEMRLSMELHELGWQVHRAYIDEGIDFTITKYWCSKCKKYSEQFIRNKKYKGKHKKCVTNLCEHCKRTELDVVSRYLQVKISEGISTDKNDIRQFSFHPKIRYNMGKEVFYVWIAVFDTKKEKTCHFYILNTKDVEKFDNIKLPTYQITDNQKTTLRIRADGAVLNEGKLYNYSCFNNRFYNNWDALELELNNCRKK